MNSLELAKELGTGKKVSSTVPQDHAKNKKSFDAGFLLVESVCKAAGAQIEYISKDPYRTIVIKKGLPEKLFIGHIDVVPGEEEQFTPKEQGGTLFFRGACDMLGPVAAMLCAFGKGANNVWIALSDNEEIGQVEGGIVTFKKQHERLLKERTLFVFDPDGGNGNIVLGQKGCLWLELLAHGKAGHGSQPHRGINAIDELMATVALLKVQLTGSERGYGPEPERGITISLNKIEGGEKINTVPDKANGLVDLRFWPQHTDTIAAVFEKLRTGANIDVTVLNRTQPWLMEQNDSRIGTLVAMMEKLRMGIGFELGLGSSDLSLFGDVAPCLMLRPVSGNHHGKDEWVSTESLNKFEALMSELMTCK